MICNRENHLSETVRDRIRQGQDKDAIEKQNEKGREEMDLFEYAREKQQEKEAPSGFEAADRRLWKK